MKKLIPIILALCLIVTPLTAKVSADDHGQSTTAAAMQTTTNPDVVFLAGTVPADSELMDAIALPVHALVLSMIEHEIDYNAQSAPFVWNALYYALSMYGQIDGRAQLTDEALLLPSESVNDFFRALFVDCSELPPLPSELSGYIRYDEYSDIYHLSLGDFAPTSIVFGPVHAQADGTVCVDGTLISLEDDSALCSFRVTLAENDTMFGFSIAEISLY